MRVLVGCEESGTVRDAFIAAGHDAVSCDILPTRKPGPHIRGTVLSHEIAGQHWDLGIFHPDCTFLAVSGARWMAEEWRQEAQLAALHFVKALWRFPIDRIAIENPVGRLSTLWRGPDQYIQPYEFGDPHRKTTGLWLKNLPRLVPTNNLGGGEQSCWKEPPSAERKRIRATTYPGIARAMADQWGNLAESRGARPRQR
jgi:hypothetical protein